MATSTDGMGNVTTYAYDSDGNITSTTDSTGATTKFEYDREGNLTKQFYIDIEKIRDDMHMVAII